MEYSVEHKETTFAKVAGSGACLVCGKPTLEEVLEYGTIERITSDCRPFQSDGRLAVCMNCGAVQKYPDEKWLDEISGIYSEYAAYYQADGEEQVILDSQTGNIRRRSDVILERLVGVYDLPTNGKALDIGCGSGVTLNALSQVLPGWRLYGQDLDKRNKARLENIPGFEGIFDCVPDEIEGKYDLITLIHSLEHFPSPGTLLKSILSKLAPSGILLVQVCNTNQNPYDLLIADHLMHFSANSLKRLADSSGFNVMAVETEWVPKELSMIATNSGRDKDVPIHNDVKGEEILGFVRGQLKWLSSMAGEANAEANTDVEFGIFGTSICATWLAGILGDKVAFFVDEDTSRQKKDFMGKSVLSPQQVSLHSKVYLALVPNIASSVKERLSFLQRQLISPPADTFHGNVPVKGSPLQLHSGIEELRTLTAVAKKVIFVSGNFNVVHPGHLRLLRFAAECGDFLVVGVNHDGFEGATLPEDMRLDGVDAIGFVNYAFILHESAEQFIAKLKPTVVVMGKEHENHDNPEKKIVEEYGGKLLFGSGEVSFSSLELLHREYIESNYSSITKPVDYPDRHDFTIRGLKKTLEKMVSIKVLVIGDLIVDEYVICDALGMSQEDPTIVVTPIETKRFVGGAGIVAAHARGFGADVRFLTVTGEDDISVYAEEKLAEHGVDCQIYRDDSRPTTFKKRYRSSGKTLLRVSQLRQHKISNDIASQILEDAKQALEGCDVLIFSDFNYGCLPQSLVDEIIAVGKEKGVLMVADSQSSSQIGDISRFRGMTLLTPTEHEARLALQDSECGLAVLAEKLAEKSQADYVVITLGAEGMLALAKNDENNGWNTDNLPAFNTSIKDTAGAGDSFLTCAAMSLCTGAGMWESIYLGSIAAACQVSRIGNTPLTQQDLIAEINYS